ncbi:MAG: FliM/FliN family flagellar motor switch protein [Myxococcales bacterium]|nr:FliM/FliN family flagellar motor switch protein [Myxococcales bacterium]
MASDAAFLFDIPVELVVELGRTKMTFGELAELQEDDVIKLDSLAGQPLDIMAGERLFGRGEVVIEDERVALRITEIVGQSESPVLAEAG